MVAADGVTDVTDKLALEPSVGLSVERQVLGETHNPSATSATTSVATIPPLAISN